VLGILLCVPITAQSQCDGRLTLEQLQCLRPCQLAELYLRAEVGTPPCGRAQGRLLCLVDRRLPHTQVWLANAAWKGKVLAADGSFVNLWTCGIQAISSHYTIGPSWLDGRPAVLMDYAPGTAIFGNTHDELRQVGPGLYLGPLYQCRPCPRLCGYIALQLETCAACRP
jgi:hypothetical protein